MIYVTYIVFRAGVAPIRLETGRYEGLEVDDRICPICKNEIETEKHVITRCPSYSVPRSILYNACTQLCDDFNSFTYIKKLCMNYQTLTYNSLTL